MDDDVVNSRVFVGGVARLHDLLFILSKHQGLIADDVAHSGVIALDQAKWAHVQNTTWDASAIAYATKPNKGLIVVGEDGEVLTYFDAQPAEEKIKPAPRTIRRANAISGVVYACGMRRQVYKRTGGRQKWQDVSAPAPKGDETVGFEAIDGYTEKEIYAVGWEGEIWQYNGTKWVNRASPTNVILSSVFCAPNDVVYVVGQNGTLIEGRNDKWSQVEWDEPLQDFWDVCWFDDKLFIATMTGLFTFEQGQLLPVDFGDLDPSTFYRLTAADGVIWSIGETNILSYDGASWRSYR